MWNRRVVAALACSLVVIGFAVPASAGVLGVNGRIWYMKEPARRAERVVSVETDGTDPHRASVNDGRTSWSRLTLSPDGTRIAFQEETKAGSRLVIMDAADGGNRVVVLPRADVFYASISWFPDGSRLLFTRADFDADDSRYLLYSSSLDGSDVVAIGTGTKYDASMAPDMTRIVYMDGQARLGVVDADGTDQHVILDSRRNTGPEWSPEGTRIAFARFVAGGSTDVFTVNPDGTGLERVVASPTLESDVDWSPDGSRLLFQRVYGDSFTSASLFTVGQDGSAPQRVTDGPSFDWPVGWAAA